MFNHATSCSQIEIMHRKPWRDAVWICWLVQNYFYGYLHWQLGNHCNDNTIRYHGHSSLLSVLCYCPALFHSAAGQPMLDRLPSGWAKTHAPVVVQSKLEWMTVGAFTTFAGNRLVPLIDHYSLDKEVGYLRTFFLQGRLKWLQLCFVYTSKHIILK